MINLKCNFQFDFLRLLEGVSLVKGQYIKLSMQMPSKQSGLDNGSIERQKLLQVDHIGSSVYDETEKILPILMSLQNSTILLTVKKG